MLCVLAKTPRAGFRLAHTCDRHAEESGIVLWLDQLDLAPSVTIVVRPTVADRGVFVPPLFSAVLGRDRLCAEGVDSFASAGNQRDEPVLTLVDVERDRRSLPRLAVVARAIGDHLVDLAAPCRVVVALREHHQQIALWGA